jgi:hypothetical protein
VRLAVAGSGDISRYRAKAQALGIGALIHFEGLCDQRRVAQLLARADVLVLPSYDEVLPLVILEALANSVAVVCTRVGEIPAVLTEGVHALFVTPGNIAELAEVLQKLLGQPGLQARLGSNGRALYVQQFSMWHFFCAIARIHQRHFGLSAEPLQAPAANRQDPAAGQPSDALPGSRAPAWKDDPCGDEVARRTV